MTSIASHFTRVELWSRSRRISPLSSGADIVPPMCPGLSGSHGTPDHRIQERQLTREPGLLDMPLHLPGR
jgi:hypothetical protein